MPDELTPTEQAAAEWWLTRFDPEYTGDTISAEVCEDVRDFVAAVRPHLYRELADHIAMFNVRPDEVELVRRIRRRADEMEHAATPCGPVTRCGDEMEPCDVHERLMSHHDGSHELCGDECVRRAGGAGR